MNIQTVKSLALCAATAFTAAVSAAETRYGLFVGVNEFENISSLSACDWDAARMYDAYTSGGTCSPANASLIVNRKARKADIRAKFAELAGKAKSGDTVLYYQSSHGGNTPDASGGDTKDAYICLTDADYSDVEFAADLQLFKDGVNVIVVLDACYSGGMFKAAGATSATDARKSGWNFATRVRKLMSRRKSSAKTVGNGPSVAFATAANWDETSSEIDRQGEFTAALLAGWEDAAADENADGKVTFAELAEYAKPIVKESSVQTSNDALLAAIVAGRAFDTSAFRLLYADGVLAGFFGDCPTSIAIAEGTKEICWSAFDDDYNSVSNLASVTIPASVEKIGPFAFYGCANLETVTFQGDFAAIDCPRTAFTGTPVCATLFPPPANDAVTSAFPIEGASGTTDGWNYLATNTDEIDGFADLGNGTVWWTWTAPETAAYEFNTFGSNFDTMISILKHAENDAGGYDVIAENDDDNSEYYYGESAVQFKAVAGVAYYIGVSGYDEAEGDITLNWQKSVFSPKIQDGMLTGFTGICPETLDLSAEPITIIGMYAFQHCEELHTLILPESLEAIEPAAFSYCENLETVESANANWQEEVEIAESAFRQTPWQGPLEMTVDEYGALRVSGFAKGDIVIPDGTKKIPSNTFQYSPLTGVTIPSSVTSIDNYAFLECDALTNIVFVAREPVVETGNENSPDYVYFDETLEINGSAFENTGISSLEIPAHVSFIEDNAFYGCRSLTNVVFKSDDRITESELYIYAAFKECSNLASVVFEPRIYSDCNEIWNRVDIYGAFQNCRNLVELDLCAGLVWIEPDSLDGCSSLASVKIADDNQELTSIDGMVYYRYADTDEQEDENGVIHVVTNSVYKELVRCPEGSEAGVVRIGLDVGDVYDGAFRNCTKLEKVQLPETFKGAIDFDAVFEGCDESIVEYYAVPHKVITLDPGYDGATLLSKKVFTEDGVVGTLPYLSRDDYDFRGWNTSPDGNGMWVYAHTFAAGLEGVDTLYAQWRKIVYSFAYYSAANGIVIAGISPYPRGSVEIPEEIDGRTVVGIASNAFYNQRGLKHIRIPATVTTIAQYAFYYCTNLETVELPKSLDGVLDTSSAFFGCGNAQFMYYEVPHHTITLDANGGTLATSEITAYTTVGDLPVPVRDGYDFMGWWTAADGGEWISPDREVSEDFTAYAHWQESVYNWAVQNYTDSHGNVIGVSITTNGWTAALSRIDEGNISGTVTVPYGINGMPVVAIGSCAFCDCSAITGVILPPTIQRIDQYAFYNCTDIAAIDIPDSVHHIGLHAFSYSGIKSIFLPALVSTISGAAFMGCRSLTEILVEENNKYYKSITGILYAKDGSTLVAWPCGKGANAIVAEGTRRIGEYAFEDSSITSVAIPDGIERIESNAFYSCSGLTEVDVPASVAYIGSHAFAHSGLLPGGVTIGNPNATIELSAFGYTSYDAAQPFTMIVDANDTVTGFTGKCPESIDIGAEAAKLGVAVTTIGRDAFSGNDHDMTALKKIVIPEGVTNISPRAFISCSSLDITLPDTLQTIGWDAFWACYALREILIPSSVESIDSYAFAYCDTLDRAYVPANLEPDVQAGNVFDGCDQARIIYYDGDAPQSVSVTLKMNDGTDAEETIDALLPLHGLPVPLRNGYAFTGWWTTADDSGEAVDDSFVAHADCIVLYAHWIKSPFSFGGDANWIFEGDGVWRSGKISNNQSSSVSMVVDGPAEVSFKWKTSSERYYDRLVFAIDADYMSEISGVIDADYMSEAGEIKGWEKKSFTIETPGAHTLKWMYIKDVIVSVGEDCGWIKDVVVSSLDAENVTVDVGEGKTVTVPRAWIDEHPALVEAAGGNVAAALQSLAGNGKMSVAGCYVLGLDPEVSTNGFKIVAFPMKADGTPDLEGLAFEPRREEWNVQEARPVVKGVKNIGDDDWTEVTEQNKELFRFFKVVVELP